MDHLLKIWPTIADLAKDLRLSHSTVASWKSRGVPAARAAEIVRAARARGAELTLEDLLTPPATDTEDAA